MKALLLSAALCLFFGNTLFSQKFWLTTYEFPGGPKTGIAAIGDTCLIAGLTNGVLRSFNEGQNWNKVLESSAIYTVHATPEGVVLAGGKGKIFVSNDFGSNWDSVALGHQYPMLEFAHQSDGSLFAISGYPIRFWDMSAPAFIFQPTAVAAGRSATTASATTCPAIKLLPTPTAGCTSRYATKSPKDPAGSIFPTTRACIGSTSTSVSMVTGWLKTRLLWNLPWD